MLAIDGQFLRFPVLRWFSQVHQRWMAARRGFATASILVFGINPEQAVTSRLLMLTLIVAVTLRPCWRKWR